MEKRLLEGIQARVKEKNYLFTLRAGDRMTERHISVREIEEAILNEDAETIEDYPDDSRSPSCLSLGFTKGGRTLHMQCTYPPRVAVITAYEPKSDEWVEWRIRKGGKP